MNQQLRPIVVTNRSFGEMSGTTIFVTSDLQDRLQGEGFRGVTFDRLENGRAFRGFKHLMEMVTRSEGCLVLTLGETRREEDLYYVNLERYMRSSREPFNAMYREVGMTVASAFLGENFPSEFAAEGTRTLQTQVIQAQRNLDTLLDALGQKPQNHPALVNGIVSVLDLISDRQRLSKELSEGLDQLRAASNLDRYRRVLDQLERRLKSRRGYPESSGDDSWQAWIYRNSWLFGPMYLEPLPWQPVGLRSRPDFIFPTLDGFFDILEIKKPDHEVLRIEGGHYTWTGTTNHAIGQAVAYIASAEMGRLALERDISDRHGSQLKRRNSVVRPRAFVLIGRDVNWEEGKRESFRNLNAALHGVEVLTYDELLRRGRKMVGLYSQTPGDPSAD